MEQFEKDLAIMYPGLGHAYWRRRHLVHEPGLGVIQKPNLVGMFRPHWRDLDPYMQVDNIEWEDNRLVVTGRANVPSGDIPRRRNTSKIVVLRPPGPIFRRLPVVL